MRTRIPQLDLLRGIAVLLVLVRHYPYYSFFRTGWVGVDLFFVLSGFLISGLLFIDWRQNRRISLSRFLIRRAFKIYPAYYFFLFVTATIVCLPLLIVGRAGHSPIRQFPALILFCQDYVRVPFIWGHTWSLAVEEQFYILLPLLLFLISKMQGRSSGRPFAIIPYISALLLIGCLAMRRAVSWPAGVIYVPFHLRADSLFAGVALGYLFHFRNIAFRALSRWWLLPLSLLLLAPLCFYSRSSDLPPTGDLAYILTCNTLAFVCLILWIVPRSQVRAPWIEHIGIYSYSIYLWHMPFVALFRQFQLRFIWFLLYLFVCIGFGICMAKVIEMRALNVREKYMTQLERLQRARKGEYIPAPVNVQVSGQVG